MPAYSFEALQADGKTRKGVVEADTARAARAQLRAQALVPLAVEPVAVEPVAAGGARRVGLHHALAGFAIGLQGFERVGGHGVK